MNRCNSIAALTLTLLTIGGTARAGWGIKDLNPLNPDAGVNKALREFDKERLNTMSPGFRPGRNFTKVYIKNNSPNPIWVAVIDIPFDVHLGNESRITDPNEELWHVHAWYKLEPGERKHVTNTDNRNVYFYAQNNRGQFWRGETRHYVRDGGKIRMVGFLKESFQGVPEEYTMNFN